MNKNLIAGIDMGCYWRGDHELHKKLIKSIKQFEVFEYDGLIVKNSGTYLATKYCRLNPPESFRDWLIGNFEIIRGIMK